MRAPIAILLIAATGCVHDSYECHLDTDCDLGTAGRCETDHHCTTIDDSCFTGRRYTDHSGDLTEQCYDGTVPLANACMGGQPPAVADGCAQAVCDLLPSCCKTGWSEACAAQAQVTCPEQTCSTRIAITATGMMGTELWELEWNGEHWLANKRGEGIWIGYLAPAPGSVDPRLAGITKMNELVIDADVTIPLAAHIYHEAASVDFDRDRRDVVALTWDDGAAAPNTTAQIQIIHLDDGSSRDVPTSDLAIVGLAWGAYDDDAYPDGAGGRFTRNLTNQSYYFLDNSANPETHERLLNSAANSGFTNSKTSAPSLNSLDWVDFDGDGVMDFVAFGYNARVHTAEGNVHVSDQARIAFDCSPIQVPRAGKCEDPNNPTIPPDPDLASIIGAVVPALPHPELVLSTDVTREVYRVSDPAGTPSIVPLQMPICIGSTCAPILALVARDLDHDGKVDIIGIDATLRVFTSINGMPFVVSPPTQTDLTFTQLRASVAGSPGL